MERKLSDEKARLFFEDLWKFGDPWDLETSQFEKDKYDLQLAMLGNHRYPRALEIGCGAGAFTRRLSGIADRVLALDISANAIAKAQQAKLEYGSVEYRVANVMDYSVGDQGPWDLVVMSETICYLGWLYSFFDVAWLAAELFAATRTAGQFLMANTCGGVEDYLLRPWIIRTYRDLFLNVGYQLKSEEMFRGCKNGAQVEVLVSLFMKP
jgi:SAM-dependent methyltransferase